MLERLRGVAGVAQLAAAPRYPGSIVLADAGGTSLAGVAKPLAVDELIGLAVGLARAVAGMHRRGVMHRDITPANIVISGDGAPCLVDFALATSLAEIRPEFTHHSEIVGTLAYLAPEQTGRTGRPVDQRADLYALGATLYELATGEPPFGTGDPLRLTHDHLARVPAPPAEVNPAVPGPLSDDHHASAGEGTGPPVPDAPRAWSTTWSGCGRPSAHPAAAACGSASTTFRCGCCRRRGWWGATPRWPRCEAAFEEALAGRCRGVLVGGAPGVGKTVLVDELRPVVTGAGWLVRDGQVRPVPAGSGVRRGLPGVSGAGPAVAGRAGGRAGRAPRTDPGGGRAERGSADRGGAGVRGAAGGAAGSGGSADRAGPGATSGGGRCCGRSRRRNGRVVVFIDDLQWAGRTPLGFVDLVLTEEPVEGLLLVGAYRDDEVDSAASAGGAAVAVARPGRRAARCGWTTCRRRAWSTMVAEMLHVDRAAAAGLAEVIEPHTPATHMRRWSCSTRCDARVC